MLLVGEKYTSKYYGDVEIISTSDSQRFSMVRFFNTGTLKIFREDQIRTGNIRDPYAPRVCGVACTGDAKTKGKNRALYSIWHDMINRCYNAQDKRHDAYKNVTVAEPWLTFETFLYDAPFIDGFDARRVESGELVLDKDIKQRWRNDKVYSTQTCCWVPKEENTPIQDSQQKPFIAISPTGEQFHDYNISKFAREHYLQRRHISGVLHKRCSTTKGWSFQYE